jgi:hypothetical protein
MAGNNKESRSCSIYLHFCVLILSPVAIYISNLGILLGVLAVLRKYKITVYGY